uniref:Mannose-6-phosphate isomerase n=1 Tax=Panagrolaimus sp. JU765 TaxID=591449 RepID=A0AC34Q220_9BILA
MQRLDCHVKNYAWGKDGEASEVARLFAAGHPDHQIGSQTPYAELWMGTHPDGPAKVRSSSENLSRLIAKSDRQSRKEVHLPFIMKIMSIKHTLSLQVHPTKEQAVWLHSKDPSNYPDQHHKPELAYALTRFELLCGFRPAAEIVRNMQAFPELRRVMGEDDSSVFETLFKKGISQDSVDLKKALRRCFANMLNNQKDTEFVNHELQSFYERLKNGVRGSLIEDTIPVLESMRKHFPGDVGCFSPLYLNHMILQPGECCFYAAEELHAYLSGECVECVGCSNNTIRAALTPKFIDKESLIKVLNYRMTTPDFYLVPPKRLEDYPSVTEYAPDCKDFTLHQIDFSNQASSSQLPVNLPALDCASIVVIVEGDAECEGPTRQRVKRGDIFYIPPHRPVRFTALYSGRLLAYRTFSYEEGPDHSKRLGKVVSKNIRQCWPNPSVVPRLVEDNLLPPKTKAKFAQPKFAQPKFGFQLPVNLPALDCASIVVIVEGDAECEGPTRQRVKRGDIFYIPPHRPVRFTALYSGRLLAYRTFSYEEGPDHSKRLGKVVSKNIRQCWPNPSVVPRLVEDNLLPPKTKAKFAQPKCAQPKFGLSDSDEYERENGLFDLDTDMDGLC